MMQCVPCNKSSLLLKEKEFFFQMFLKCKTLIHSHVKLKCEKTLKSQKTVPLDSKLILFTIIYLGFALIFTTSDNQMT
jgi:hypothetical protein